MRTKDNELVSSITERRLYERLGSWCKTEDFISRHTLDEVLCEVENE